MGTHDEHNAQGLVGNHGTTGPYGVTELRAAIVIIFVIHLAILGRTRIPGFSQDSCSIFAVAAFLVRIRVNVGKVVCRSASYYDVRPFAKEVHRVIGDMREWHNAIMKVPRDHDSQDPENPFIQR